MSQKINQKISLHQKNIISFYLFTIGIILTIIFIIYTPCEPTAINKKFNLFTMLFSLHWYIEVFGSLYGTGLLITPLLFFWQAYYIFHTPLKYWIISLLSSIILLPLTSTLLCFYKIHTYFPGFLAGGIIGKNLLYLISLTLSDTYILPLILFFFSISLLSTIQKKGFQLCYNLLSAIMHYTQMIRILTFMYNIFFSWIIFFIPITKKLFTIKTPYNINDLLNKTLQEDLMYINHQYSIKESKLQKNQDQTQTPENQNNENYDTETQLLKKHLEVPLSLIKIFHGPVINTIIYYIPLETKISSLLSSKNEIARIFGNYATRVTYPVKDFNNCIAIEIPNKNHHPVSFMHYINLNETLLQQSNMSLPFILGVDTRGNAKIVDLVKFPHALIAGTTGSGKSSLLHAIIMSLLWNNYCIQEVEIILFDPKRVEFFNYQSLSSCIKEVLHAYENMHNTLLELINEMERRYQLFTKHHVKNIQEFKLYQTIPLPYIILIIDEFADLSFSEYGDKISNAITKLAQMSRAAGIHIIMATQRPSANIITGSIKANFPTKIACRVTSALESRIILDCDGAEKLIGMGDMLVSLSGKEIERLQSLYVDDISEIKHIVNIFKQKQKNHVVQ